MSVSSDRTGKPSPFDRVRELIEAEATPALGQQIDEAPRKISGCIPFGRTAYENAKAHADAISAVATCQAGEKDESVRLIRELIEAIQADAASTARLVVSMDANTEALRIANERAGEDGDEWKKRGNDA